MHIAFLKENHPETRVSTLPVVLKKLVELGATVWIESGLGETVNIPNAHYENAGAKISNDRHALLSNADIIVSVLKPQDKDIPFIKKNAIYISFLYPFSALKTIQMLAKQEVSAISMDMIPRTTLAQKMDAVSSQSNISGYAAVIFGAQHLPHVLPMMMTPAGTIPPARIFVIGAGVAGLQAIATAKRLGARVDAFDVRPAAQEQITSLGARCIKVDIADEGEEKYGYAKALTSAQLKKQQEAMSRACQGADLIISTAKIFGKPAPLLINNEIIKKMKPGSVIVDMAIDTGGNVEGAELHKIIEKNHIKIIGIYPLCNLFPVTASQMYANNIYHLIATFWNDGTKQLELNMDNEIIKNSLITHHGKILQPF